MTEAEEGGGEVETGGPVVERRNWRAARLPGGRGSSREWLAGVGRQRRLELVRGHEGGTPAMEGAGKHEGERELAWEVSVEEEERGEARVELGRASK